MHKTLVVVGLLLCGCVADREPEAEATAPKSGHSQADDDAGKPRQVCEHTMEGSEPKTFCY